MGLCWMLVDGRSFEAEADPTILICSIDADSVHLLNLSHLSEESRACCCSFCVDFLTDLFGSSR